MTSYFLRREPVVNRQKAIIATRLISHAPSAAAAAADLAQLADVWPDTRSVLISLAEALPDADILSWQLPQNAMIELPADRLSEAAMHGLLQILVAARVPVCLGDFAPGMIPPPQLQFRFILADAAKYPQMRDAPGLIIARHVADHQHFAEVIAAGYSGAAGWFFLKGMPISDKLNASHGQIVRVLNLVRHNAEVKDIEAALKQDVTLSYKLLRYINSAGFGLTTEIQSFKHAVTMLGYDKLNKWLSLLLVTASRDPAAPALMQTAIARGRFMEIIGKASFDKAQIDNLFITGAFSLLDILLGSHMDVVLEQMNLPDAIATTLRDGSGPYAALLNLARICESEDIEGIKAQAAALQLSAETINHAQIEALVFADSLQFN